MFKDEVHLQITCYWLRLAEASQVQTWMLRSSKTRGKPVDTMPSKVPADWRFVTSGVELNFCIIAHEKLCRIHCHPMWHQKKTSCSNSRFYQAACGTHCWQSVRRKPESAAQLTVLEKGRYSDHGGHVYGPVPKSSTHTIFWIYNDIYMYNDIYIYICIMIYIYMYNDIYI